MSSHTAFKEAVAALSRDMPILMHGSGDVLPSEVNSDTVQLLSELTVRYISNLVDAAIDAQQLLAGGHVKKPPPPRYPRSRQPRLPSAPEEPKNEQPAMAPTTASKKGSSAFASDIIKAMVLKKRPLYPDVDYWDEPLPEPKIVRKKAKPAHDRDTASAVTAFNQPVNADEDEESKPVHIDHWVGAAGVDLWEQSRSRAAYVRMPDALGVQCFIFPICHDGFLYGKVMQVQASRRAIVPVLTDSVLMDLVRTEGALRHAPRRRRTKVRNKKESSGDADVEEDDDDEGDDDDNLEQENGAAWPGMEYLLPVHTITEAATSGDGSG